MELSPDEVAVDSEMQLKRGPGLVAVIIFRFLIGVLACVPFPLAIMATKGGTRIDSVSGSLLVFSFALIAIIGLPSIIIAIGLIRRGRWAAWVAMIEDALVLAAVTGLMLSSVFFPRTETRNLALSGDQPWVAVALGLIFIVEGACIAGWMWRRALAPVGFVAVSLFALATGMLIPAAAHRNEIAAVQPLVSYAREHWIDIPQSAGMSIDEMHIPLQVQRGQSRSARVIRWDRVTLLRIETPKAHWEIRAPAVGMDHWRLSGGPKRYEGHIVLTGAPRGGKLPLASQEQALGYLQSAGVIDTELRPAGTFTRNGVMLYCFYSPKANGIYGVAAKAGGIVLYMGENAEIQ